MTTPTKPTKEATTPLPVLTEALTPERVRELRDAYEYVARDRTNLRAQRDEAKDIAALADHWLRTQVGWVAWKPGDAVGERGIYWTTTENFYDRLGVATKVLSSEQTQPMFWLGDKWLMTDRWRRVIAYWPIALPAPFAPPQEQA